MPRKITGALTSGGIGSRTMPLNLYSSTTMIPKGLMRVMGLPITDTHLYKYSDCGFVDVHIITKFTENRDMLANRYSDGQDRFGFKIHYSDPILDLSNNGSAYAILKNIQLNNMTGDTIVLPNDNLFEFNLDNVMRTHRDNKALVTIMTRRMTPRQTIKTYGLVKSDINDKALSLIEKPKDEKVIMREYDMENPSDLDSMLVSANTAGYIINNDLMKEAMNRPWIMQAFDKKLEGRKKFDFDMAGYLLENLIKEDAPIYTVPIDNWGDLGSPNLYLQSVLRAIGGGFPSITNILEKQGYKRFENNVWIHADTLLRKNMKGQYIQQMMSNGKATIGPNAFIGRDTRINNGATITYSDVEKQVNVGENATIDNAFVSPYTIIGQNATVRNASIGLHAYIMSETDNPTLINGGSVIGGQVEIPAGARLKRTVVFPDYKFKKERIFDGAQLVPSIQDINAWNTE